MKENRLAAARFLAALTLLQAAAFASMSPAEDEQLNTALYLANLSRSDLQFERKLTPDKYRLPIVQQALDNPLHAAERLEALHASALDPVSSQLQNIAALAFGDHHEPKEGLPTLGPVPEAVPESLRDSVEILLGAISEANGVIKRATSNLTSAERRELIEGLPRWCAGNQPVKLQFAAHGEVDRERLLRLVAKVDLPAIREAAAHLAAATESQMPKMRALASSIHLEDTMRFVVAGITVELSAEDGRIHSSRDTNLLISLGDHNRFIGRFGAGIGYASVLIDFGSEGRYDVPDASVGVGLLGIGLAYVEGAHNMFDGGSACFGSGFAGVGAFSHKGDGCTFRADSFSEGFGCFGVGLMCDDGNADTIEGQLFTQGAARTQGAGWLVERGSDDFLFAAGHTFIGSRDAPVSCSQACSAGFETSEPMVGGGLAMLTALGNHETLMGGIRCQGSAQWGGVASLSDGGSGAVHSACQEAQSFANHESAAFVFHSGAGGQFSTRFAASHACSANSSVALFFERGSRVSFSSRQTPPARAHDNSLAIFFDEGAANVFSAAPTAQAPPGGRPSISLFCGSDQEALFSASVDLQRVQATPGEAVSLQQTSAFDPASETPGRMQELTGQVLKPDPAGRDANPARDQGVSAHSTGSHPQRSGAAEIQSTFDHALERGVQPNLDFMAQLVDRSGEDGRAVLVSQIRGNDPYKSQIALELAARCPGAGMDRAILEALDRPALARAAVRAAAECQVTAAASKLMPLCASIDPLLVLDSLLALDRLDPRAATGTAAACLTSSSWPVRQVAIELLAKFPDDALVAASGLLASASVRDQRTGVALIAAIKTPDSISRLRHLLDTPSPAIQLQALIGLAGCTGSEVQAKIVTLQGSKDPFVSRFAREMVLDR